MSLNILGGNRVVERIALVVVLGLLGTQETQAQSDQTLKQRDLTSRDVDAREQGLVEKVFAGRLLEIAAEYRQYERMDQKMHWSPALCFLPPQPPVNLGAISASDVAQTHGRKLYYLFVRKPADYKMNVWSEQHDLGEPTAPLGQVLVKEAWKPVPANVGKQSAGNKRITPKVPNAKSTPYAFLGDKKYHAGDKQGLYIMYKTSVDTPGTDLGWVYGTVAADGKTVSSVGRLKNCMHCHRESTADRQLGFSVSALGGKLRQIETHQSREDQK
jgi:hypothetical protein